MIKLLLKIKSGILNIFIIIEIFFISNTFAQSYSIAIPENQLQILAISVNYYFSATTYKPINPSLNLQAQALGTIQDRYNFNHSIISSEYRKLKELKLINIENQRFLDQYWKTRIENFDIRPYDLSLNSNTQNILKYICAIYEYPEIRNEIKLLSECEYELRRLKTSFPSDYYTTKRYRAISKLLQQLATCKTSEIGGLSWEYFELQEDLEIKKRELTRYVISTNLNVRQFASTNAPIIKTLKMGDKLELIEVINENWSKVFIPITQEDIEFKQEMEDALGGEVELIRIGYVYSKFISK